MALSAKTNQLTGPGATGNAATTDPGFEPKALIIWNSLQTSIGAIADMQSNIGVASSASDEVGTGYTSNDNQAAGDCSRVIDTGAILTALNAGANTVNLKANVNSFDATGFTLNWTTLSTTSPLFDYLALGGSDITNVKAGNFSAITTTGSQAVTGVGFQPDIVFFLISPLTSSSAAAGNASCPIGVAKSSSERWTVANYSDDGATTMDTNSYFGSSHCISILAGPAIAATADFVSMDPDGFTVNWDDAAPSAIIIGYLAIKGGQWKVGTDTQRTSTGAKATTGVGFQPAGVFFASHCLATVNSVVADSRRSVGASTAPTQNICLWSGDRDNVADSIANTIMSNSKCLVMATEGTSATPTTNAEADLDSLDADGFTLDWTTADATARVFGYVAFGSNPAGVTPASPGYAAALGWY